ncbi:MAG: hypothetical protein II077_18325, partial [Treponema sp.]|nr:hypothetical protein [Treponema sp.]
KFLISILFVILTLTLISCKKEEKFICSYTDLIKDDYEQTCIFMKEKKCMTFYITGVVQEYYSPKDQPYLNECVVYLYDDKLFDNKKCVGKMISITMKPQIPRDCLGKEITVECKYKGVDSFKLEEDYHNFFCIEFKNGKVVDSNPCQIGIYQSK